MMLLVLPVPVVLGPTKGVEEILVHPTKCIKLEPVALMSVILNHSVKMIPLVVPVFGM
jgi:hypothetical protein